MTGKQEELRQRMAALLRDLDQDGRSDPEALWLIGNLAASLVDKAKATSWSGLKGEMTQDTYRGLVRDFQQHGNALWQTGQPKHAYAIQALAISIVASTQRGDPQLRQGEALLDAVIEDAVRIYRKTQEPN